jgi:hypothetical protein
MLVQLRHGSLELLPCHLLICKVNDAIPIVKDKGSCTAGARQGAAWKIPGHQRRNEQPSCHRLSHYLTYTKSAQEPTSLTPAGNSADSRGVAECRDTVYCTPPNAAPQPLPIAAATQGRRLLAVGSSAWFGAVSLATCLVEESQRTGQVLAWERLDNSDSRCAPFLVLAPRSKCLHGRPTSDIRRHHKTQQKNKPVHSF